MKKSLSLPIIGHMRSPFTEKFGIPRQPNLVDVHSRIELIVPYNDPLAFVGIEQFSHLWLLWYFHHNHNNKQHSNHQQDDKQHSNQQQHNQHQNQDHNAQQLQHSLAESEQLPFAALKDDAPSFAKFRPMIRPPRLGGNQKIGVFASRSMYRPAPIGLSVVKFLRIEQVGSQLFVWVSGADLLDGTPILDLKPYITYSDAIVDAQSGYAQQQPQPKTVLWSSSAMQQQQQYLQAGQCSLQTLNELNAVLALDPRPAYQDDAEREYGMTFANVNVRFCVNDTQIIVHRITLQ